MLRRFFNLAASFKSPFLEDLREIVICDLDEEEDDACLSLLLEGDLCLLKRRAAVRSGSWISFSIGEPEALSFEDTDEDVELFLFPMSDEDRSDAEGGLGLGDSDEESDLSMPRGESGFALTVE